MVNSEVIRAHQKDFLQAVKDRTEPTSYTVEGIEIKVNPAVFPPATDTKLLAANIHVLPSDRTLDLTSGSGVFSIIAGRQGASGISVDINPAAVRNSEENFKLHNVRMKAVESNLYAALPEEKFDQIFANGPFFEGDIADPLDFACYGAQAFVDGMLGGVRRYLKPEGKLLVVLSAWSDLEYFGESVKRNNLEASHSDTRDSDDGKRTYHLYNITIPQ